VVSALSTNHRQAQLDLQEVWHWLAEVADPEIPVVSVVDLGIVRALRCEPNADGAPELVVTLTPTYSGCPAVKTIEEEVLAVLARHGVERARIETQLSPPWSTDWISAAARERLRWYGIAPPGSRDDAVVPLVALGTPATTQPTRSHAAPVPCPRCGAADTQVVSEFGSTACKALHRCRVCAEPFEYFKPF
jgi:ring-1,2-phenylacetyl-CoA epoxidase subunit PaaD